MKSLNFLLFMLVFSGVYLTGNYYVFIRAFHAFPFNGPLKVLFNILFWFLCLSFIASRFTGHGSFTITHHFLSWTGSLWIVCVFYFFLLVLFIDIVRLTNVWLGFLPLPSTLAYFKLKAYTLFGSILLVMLLVGYGYINARMPRITKHDIATKKIQQATGEIKIAVVSDIHLGSLVNERQLEKLTRLVNSQNPDLILLAGDLLDEAQAPIFKYNIGYPLKNLKAPLGKFAVPGNHEYIGGIKTAQQYIESLNITMLRDSTVKLSNNILLIGRDDIQKNRFGTLKRKALKELLQGYTNNTFTLVMDHQPFNLSEPAEAMVDLQVSGHTHKGQFWPFNYIINAMYEIGHGLLQKNSTHIYVTSGFGTWGPPVRIGNRPEIAIITLKPASLN